MGKDQSPGSDVFYVLAGIFAIAGAMLCLAYFFPSRGAEIMMEGELDRLMAHHAMGVIGMLFLVLSFLSFFAGRAVDPKGRGRGGS